MLFKYRKLLFCSHQSSNLNKLSFLKSYDSILSDKEIEVSEHKKSKLGYPFSSRKRENLRPISLK